MPPEHGSFKYTGGYVAKVLSRPLWGRHEGFSSEAQTQKPRSWEHSKRRPADIPATMSKWNEIHQISHKSLVRELLHLMQMFSNIQDNSKGWLSTLHARWESLLLLSETAAWATIYLSPIYSLPCYYYLWMFIVCILPPGFARNALDCKLCFSTSLLFMFDLPM